MPYVVSGLFTFGFMVISGYLITRCVVCSPAANVNRDYYVITKEQFEELKNRFNDTQPTIAPPEYTTEVSKETTPLTS